MMIRTATVTSEGVNYTEKDDTAFINRPAVRPAGVDLAKLASKDASVSL